ncbi:MAG: response regulator [Planctomycetes bacterium]|nr:response regulator [Planctomycetota bacterium]
MNTSLVVLVADEEPAIRDLLRDYLAELDLAAIPVATGQDVLKVLRTTHVDVVLIDAHLPGMDAQAVFREAVKIDPALRRRFIFTGPLTGPQGRTEFGSLMLTKPFRLEDLAAAILELCDRALPQRAPRERRAAEGGAVD